MAESFVQLPADSSGKKLRTRTETVGANEVHEQIIRDINAEKEFGAWTYAAGTLAGAGSVTASGRCVGIRVYAHLLDGSFNVNGGNTVLVRAGTGVDIGPKGNLVNPVVNWVSGTLDVVVAVVN